MTAAQHAPTWKIEDPVPVSVPAVYAAINRVQAELAATGISKDRTAKTGGSGTYQFRGIDDMYNVVGPLLAKHSLCILPRVLSRDITERKSSAGNALFYVVVEVEFDLVAAADGSKHTVRTIGEAMDSGDKATNKAMSAAYKYAIMQSFAIPTEGGSVDSESDTHEVAPKQQDGNGAHPIDTEEEALRLIDKAQDRLTLDEVAGRIAASKFPKTKVRAAWQAKHTELTKKP